MKSIDTLPTFARDAGFDAARLTASEQRLLERVNNEGSIAWVETSIEDTRYLDRLALRGKVRSTKEGWHKL